MEFQDMFEFETNKYKCWMKNNGEQNCTAETMEPYKSKWKVVSIMGTKHIQTRKGVVFNAPYARRESTTKKMVGTIVLKEDSKNYFNVAEGSWYYTKKYSEGTIGLTITERGQTKKGKKYTYTHDYTQEYLKDPHAMDQTGSAFAQGDFYPRKDLFNFVVGAPNADNLRGITYICRDCFGTDTRDRRKLQAPNPQRGERFGAAVAAVDIDGDSLDDVVVGAPFHSSKVIKVFSWHYRQFDKPFCTSV